jgi:hypothetical protein
MTVVSKLMLLGLAATLSSPIRQDQNVPGPDGQRLNQLWLVTYTNETGAETIAQVRLSDGAVTPLIAVDLGQLENIMPVARKLTEIHKVKLRVVEFTNRVDIQDISP